MTDRELLARRLTLQQHPTNWIALRTKRRNVPNKNRSAHAQEHADAIAMMETKPWQKS